jgi:hypothetical protein
MSDTITINTAKNADERKKNLVGKVSSIAAGAAAGVVGSAIASNIENNDTIEDVIETPEEISQEPNEDGMSEETAANHDTTSQADTNPEQESISNNHPEHTPSNPSPTPNAGENITLSNQPVNPDEIADAIISENQVDPNDIDMADVINFDEIGTVYTVDGENHTAAIFHDNEGNELMMVDVDGDDVFDLIYDESGEAIAQVSGNLTVDDAQLNIADDNTYLAHNDNDTTSEIGAETIENDLIS